MSTGSADFAIELIVRGVMVSGDKLLVCRGKGAKICYLPGGHIDPGESAPVALAREIQEEMGLGCTVGRFLGACEHTFLQKGNPIHEMNILFELHIDGLTFRDKPQAQEAWIAFEWVDLADLDAAALEPAPLRPLIKPWALGADASWRGW